MLASPKAGFGDENEPTPFGNERDPKTAVVVVVTAPDVAPPAGVSSLGIVSDDGLNWMSVEVEAAAAFIGVGVTVAPPRDLFSVS